MSNMRIDFNLIKVFVAIYETGSVSAAAERLFMTQPSASYSLAKLRDILNDPLFVRGGDGMLPTTVADLTYKRFSAAIASIEGALQIGKAFEPRLSTQLFRIGLTAIGASMFVPPVMRRIQKEAPDVEIEVLQIDEDAVQDWLQTGKVDAVIANMPLLQGTARHMTLFTERYVCLLREDHPFIRSTINLEQFVAARHVMVASSFSGHRIVDNILRQQGIIRRIALHIPHFTILPQLISESDLLVTLPSRIAKLFQAYGNLKVLDIPVEIPSFKVQLFWHESQEEKAAQQWLRRILCEVLSE